MSDAQERRVVRAALATRAFVLFVVVSLTAALTVLVVLAIQDNKRIRQNTEIQAFIKEQAVENHEISELIRDCVEPDGECAERGRKQTADAVSTINQVAVYAAACADKPGVQGETEIYACVVRLIAEADEERKQP